MIQFRNDYIRTKFHELPVETQLSWELMSVRFFNRGQQLVIDEIVQNDRILEVIVRINKQMDLGGAAS